MFRAPPALRRFGIRLPAWLALLAIGLRLLLPALHDRRAHQHVGGTCCVAGPVAPACTCGRTHAPKTPVIAAAPAAHGACLACELLLAAPGAPVPVPLALPRFGAVRGPSEGHRRSARPHPRLHRHRARAPPGTTVRRR